MDAAFAACPGGPAKNDVNPATQHVRDTTHMGFGKPLPMVDRKQEGALPTDPLSGL